MKKVVARLIWIPLGLLFVVFLVANREPVAVSLDPLSTDDPAIATPPLPLFLWLALSMLFGIGLGAAAIWSSAGPARRRARAEHRELKSLKERAAGLPATVDPPPRPEGP
jgi:hypothetical protein